MSECEGLQGLPSTAGGAAGEARPDPDLLVLPQAFARQEQLSPGCSWLPSLPGSTRSTQGLRTGDTSPGFQLCEVQLAWPGMGS